VANELYNHQLHPNYHEIGNRRQTVVNPVPISLQQQQAAAGLVIKYKFLVNAKSLRK
jgi:hypothetical protein